MYYLQCGKHVGFWRLACRYGANGFPAWGIPPGGGLLFEIEVLKIKGAPDQKNSKKPKNKSQETSEF